MCDAALWASTEEENESIIETLIELDKIDKEARKEGSRKKVKDAQSTSSGGCSEGSEGCSEGKFLERPADFKRSQDAHQRVQCMMVAILNPRSGRAKTSSDRNLSERKNNTFTFAGPLGLEEWKAREAVFSFHFES